MDAPVKLLNYLITTIDVMPWQYYKLECGEYTIYVIPTISNNVIVNCRGFDIKKIYSTDIQVYKTTKYWYKKDSFDLWLTISDVKDGDANLCIILAELLTVKKLTKIRDDIDNKTDTLLKAMPHE